MQLLPAYLLKVSFALTLVYCFYYVLLRPLTYYHWNRWFLLLCSLFAFVAPLLSIELQTQSQPALQAVSFITGITGTTAPASAVLSFSHFSFSAEGLLLVVFFPDLFFLLARFLFRLSSLARIKRTASLVSNGPIRIYHISKGHPPFSFGNSIYIDPSLYSKEEMAEIIEHEKAHLLQHHTVDMIFSECISIINWFNPFAWLIRNNIRQNLEFIADDVVLKKGADRKNYQYLLLKVSGNMQYILANNLLFPPFKKEFR